MSQRGKPDLKPRGSKANRKTPGAQEQKRRAGTQMKTSKRKEATRAEQGTAEGPSETRGGEAALSYVQNGLQQAEGRTGSPTPFLKLPSSPLPPLSAPTTGGRREAGDAQHCWPALPARSPDRTLLSCMSRLAPFFSSKSVASTLLTAAAQCRADFPARETSVSADCREHTARPSHQQVS